MDSRQSWDTAEAFSGGAPPPLIGVPLIGVPQPELDFPQLNVGAGAPSIQVGPARGPSTGAGAAPSTQLTEEQWQALSLSGNINLGQGLRVGRQGIRGYEAQQPSVAAYGAPPLDLQPGLGAPPGVLLTQQDFDILSNTGSLEVAPGLRVGSTGVRAAPDGSQHGDGANRFPYAQEMEVRSLGDLEVKEKLGEGTSARVHLAQHRSTGKYYALKDIQVSLDRRALSELGTEIQISTSVVSNHVVRCHNAFYEEGHMTLVLEYMDGGSMADLLARVGRIAEFYLADIARQALRGFKDLHTHRPNPVIHRDIKPSNLLVNRAGELKISDFGVSRVLEDSNDVGRTFAGTFTYMSPERIVGRPYGFNSDIWAFGLSLLECSTGEYPYQPSMDYFTLLNAVKSRDPPTAPPDEFSPEFCDFISCCLQKDPDQRWSAEQLLGHPFCRKYENTRLVDLLNSTF